MPFRRALATNVMVWFNLDADLFTVATLHLDSRQTTSQTKASAQDGSKLFTAAMFATHEMAVSRYQHRS